MIAFNLQDRPTTRVFSRRIARNHAQHLPHPRTSDKTAEQKRDLDCVTWPYPNISCSEWSRSRKIRTAPNAGWQHVLQRSHEIQVTGFFVLLTVLAKSFIMFVVFARHKCSTCARTWRAHHALTKPLVAYVRHVSPSTFVTRFTDVPACHGARQIRNNVVVPFNIVVK